MARITIIGADGQLGFDLVRELLAAGHAVAGLTHADIELSDAESVRVALARTNPEVVINTAAVNVESSETDPVKAFAVNAVGALNLARAVTGVRLLHLSTDYVFDGAKGSPYVETDAANPINSYGASKFAGETLLLAEAPDALVIRSSGLYGEHGCRAKGGMNFVTTMLRLAAERDRLTVVDDERLSPTGTLPLSRQIAAIVEQPELAGVVHATAHGSASWFEFAREIFRLAALDVDLRPVASAEFAASAAVKVLRPADTSLDNARLREHGIDRMQPWQEQLADYVAAIGELKNR